jgi:hypothetical protein
MALFDTDDIVTPVDFDFITPFKRSSMDAPKWDDLCKSSDTGENFKTVIATQGKEFME